MWANFKTCVFLLKFCEKTFVDDLLHRGNILTIINTVQSVSFLCHGAIDSRFLCCSTDVFHRSVAQDYHLVPDHLRPADRKVRHINIHKIRTQSSCICSQTSHKRTPLGPRIATSFPGSLLLPPPLEGGKRRDPGNEVARIAVRLRDVSAWERLKKKYKTP